MPLLPADAKLLRWRCLLLRNNYLPEPHMLKIFLAALCLIPGLTFAQVNLSGDDAAKAEQTLAEWLAHPLEFGVKPKRIRYLNSVQNTILGSASPVNVHIVEYEMPNGTYGRGFVNPITWSFLGPVPYDQLTDVQLVTAYIGWAWIFPAINNGRALTKFEPRTLDALIRQLASEGITEVQVIERYKVNESEFFEFSGVRESRPIKGAGSAGSKLILDATSPRAFLPMVYTYLGLVLRREI